MVTDVVKRIAILVGAVAIQELARKEITAYLNPAPATPVKMAGLSDDYDFTSDIPNDIDVPVQAYSPSPYYAQQPYSPYQQPYGYPYQTSAPTAYPPGYAAPINPYAVGQQTPYYSPASPYSTVSPQYPYNPAYPTQPVYQQQYNPYGTTYMPTGNYGNPQTTYPPVATNPFASLVSSIFGTPNQAANMTAAEALYDQYVQYGIQNGILQTGFCTPAPAGKSQYHNCFFTVILTSGKSKSVNFATAARMMKKYQTTGKLT